MEITIDMKWNKLLIKVGITFIGILLFFIYGFNEAEGAEWKLFQATSTGSIYHYDSTGIKRFANNSLWVWVRIIETVGLSKEDLKRLEDPERAVDVIEKAQEKSTGVWKQLFEINCSERMFRILSATLYDKKGSIKDDYQIPSEWVPIPPNSVTNYLSKIVCPLRTDKVKPSFERPPKEKIPIAKPTPAKTYAETVSGWKSYQDLVKWMEREFSFDVERYEKFKGRLPVPRTPEDTFQLQSGIYIDSAMFSKETLNRINSSYKAQIVILIIRPYGFNHYVCSFRKDGNIFIMDYGTPHKEVTGVHGPYSSLEEYKKFYEMHQPMESQIEAITYLP